MRFRKLKQQTKNKSKNNPKTNILHARISDKIKAFITDMFMIYVPILYLITYVVMDGKDDFQASNWAPFVAVSLYGFISSILLHKFAQTPGNKAYTMKVLDASTHKNIGFFQALVRFVSFLFFATILLGFIVPFYRKDRRSLHDIIAKTVVLVSED